MAPPRTAPQWPSLWLHTRKTSRLSDIANPGDGTVAKHVLTGYSTLNDMVKFELTPARGQQQRVAAALITSCEQTNTGSTSQPAVKSFGMDKMQQLEPMMGTQAIPVFQRLRRLTMILNPAHEAEPKPTLDVDEDHWRALERAKTLNTAPTDQYLKDLGHGRRWSSP